MENRSINLRFLLRGPDRYTLDSPIVIVFIDEASAMAYGYRSPTPRRLLADLVNILHDKGAAAIGIDVILDRSYEDVGETLLSPPGPDMETARTALVSANAALADALANAGDRVVLVKNLYLPAENPVPEIRSEILPRFAKNVHLGYTTSKSEGDDYFRWTSVCRLPGDHESFAAKLYEIYKGKPFEIPDDLRVTPREPWILIDFPGPPTRLNPPPWLADPGYNFEHFAAYDVVDSNIIMLPDDMFKDKIVLIGSAIEDSGDVFLTPFSTQKNRYLTSFGVELQAIALSMMLENRFIHEAGPTAKFLFLAVFFTVAALLFLFLKPIMALFALPACMLTWAVLCAWVFVNHNFLIPIASPVTLAGVAFMICQAVVQLTEQRYSRFLRSAFQQYMPPQLLDKLIQSEKGIALGGERQNLSIFFSDLADFTTISEQLTPERLIEFLHVYFEEMTTILFRHRGTLDKYIGDAVMAFFGAPNPVEAHGVKACETALLMQQRLDELNEENPPGWVPVGVRAGVNTAEVFVGNMGSNTRFNYTVMGDGVNLASRMEGINKLFGTRILISQSTLDHVQGDPEHADRFLTREVGRFIVKGKKKPVAVFDLMAFKKEATPDQVEIKTRYEDALSAFYQRDFKTARTEFEALQQDKSDKASEFMLRQLDDFRENPPGPNWAGDISIKTK